MNEKAKDLSNTKLKTKNMDSSVEVLQICQKIINIAKKSQEQMSDRKIFPALKSMDAMRTLLVKLPTCQFKNHMNSFIQQTVNNVKVYLLHFQFIFYIIFFLFLPYF